MNDTLPEPAPSRPLGQRVEDTLRRLETDVDAWVSTAAPGTGRPWLVPLSFVWDGATLLFATGSDSPTMLNAAATGQVWVGLGATRDVVLVEGTAACFPIDDLPLEEGDRFAANAGWDPRGSRQPCFWLRVTPVTIKAWREENELATRDVMRDGRWLR